MRFSRQGFKYTSRQLSSISFSNYGNPRIVLKPASSELKPLSVNDVRARVLMAPINPADLNFVEGVYGITASFPAVAGGECVAEIEEVGKGVKNLKVGDWVIPAVAAIGTWQKKIVAAEDSWIQVPKDIPSYYAATIAVNPCTAYRLLNDFVSLKAGDYIIQNAANSAVGMSVIQLAREAGIKTINIIRSNRPDAANTLRLLTNLGGDINITDDYVSSAGFQEILKDIPGVKLGLNSVGGDSVYDIARVLENKGTIVTYGGMSKQKINIPADLLSYKQLQLKGYWMSTWYKTHPLRERTEMMNHIFQLIRDKKFTLFFESHDFDDFDYALEKSLEPFYFRKVLINVDHPDRFEEHDSIPESEFFVHEGPAY